MNDPTANLAIERPSVLPPDSTPGQKRSYREFARQFFNLASPYWRSEQKYSAWFLLITVLSLNFIVIYFSVLINKWNGAFFDVLQNMQKDQYVPLLIRFCWIIAAYIIIAVTSSFLQSLLAFRWRMWLTQQMMGNWLHNSTFCRLFTYKTKTENPDQRISQDLATFTSSSLSLGLSIVAQITTAVTFGVILWTLSSVMVFDMPNGAKLDIPGFMLWLTLIYVTFCTVVIFKVGKPLVKLDYKQEKVEADFRFSLMRIRDRRDEVAALKGEKAEFEFLNRNLKDVMENFKQIIVRNIYVNSFQNFFMNATTVVPVLAAAPMFFAGKITLGILMQIVNAFNRVEGSLMLFASQFETFAAWKATFDRIVDFKHEMIEIQDKVDSKDNKLNVRSHNDAQINVNNLQIHLPDNNKLTQFNFSIEPKEKVLIMGRSGLGKSTLLKCIAGHWPFASGTISRPEDVMIIPQKPYFPIGTLHDSILYPNLEREVSDAEMSRVLEICHLSKLPERLHERSDWNSTLSLGEQQRLNFARIILTKPRVVIMDEPTASMDKSLEVEMFRTLFEELPDTTVLTIGHSHELKALHSRCITVE